jgi:hypothetical protein
MRRADGARVVLPLLAGAALAGCVPRLAPLTGAPAPARFPATELGGAHRRVVFDWEMNAGDIVARGNGAARIAPPDSVRLDFFLAGGMGGGAAVVVGDSVRLPSEGDAADLLPPPPMLWAALGRLSLPALPDTEARRQGATLRANVGRPVQWRVEFQGDTLRRLERVAGGRVREWVSREPGGRVHYRRESDRRTLDLVITTSVETGPFDATLWSFR